MLWMLLWRGERRRMREAATAGPTLSLFDRLCSEHHLTEDERLLLLDVQDDWGLANPVLLFVDAELLEQAGAPELKQKIFGRAA